MKRVVTAAALAALCVGCGGYESYLEAERASRNWIKLGGTYIQWRKDSNQCDREFIDIDKCKLLTSWENNYRWCLKDEPTNQLVCFSNEGDPVLSDGVLKYGEKLDEADPKVVKRFKW